MLSWSDETWRFLPGWSSRKGDSWKLHVCFSSGWTSPLAWDRSNDDWSVSHCAAVSPYQSSVSVRDMCSRSRPIAARILCHQPNNLLPYLFEIQDLRRRDRSYRWRRRIDPQSIDNHLDERFSSSKDKNLWKSHAHLLHDTSCGWRASNDAVVQSNSQKNPTIIIRR